MTTVARRPSAQNIAAAPQGERGFTLIELSIVLVIIGLLIGGVLQGQEMINNTRLKTTVAQVDAITAAVQTFEDKYRVLPGDATNPVPALIGATTAAGADANGVIGGTAAVGGGALALAAAIANTSESSLVFNQLGQASLLQGVDNLGLAQANSTMNANIGNGAAFDVATFTFIGVGGGNFVGVRLRTGTAAAPTPGISGVDAFSLDQRYDDGIGNTGRWQAVANGGACFVAATGVYAAGANVCMPHIRLR